MNAVQVRNKREKTGRLPFRHEVLMLLSIATITLWAYAAALGGPFVFDDKTNILNNPHIRVSNIAFSEFLGAAIQSPSSLRPVANLSFAVNYYFHGYDVVGYRIVNILIHLITGVLLYYLVKVTLRLPGARHGIDPSQYVPFYTAALWIVHPLHTQSVTYIVQRMNSMAAMFYILSLLLYVKGRLSSDQTKGRALFAASTLAGVMALGSKQIAATLPMMVFLYEWYFFRQLDWGWLKDNIRRFVVPLAVFALIALLYLGFDPLERIVSAYGLRDFTMSQRVLTEFRVVIFYLSLIFFPHPSRLSLDHAFSLSSSLINPISTIFSLFMIIGSIAFAVISARRLPLISFCILWFFGNLVIESSVIGLEIIFEHRTYLPSMFLMLAIILGIEKMVRWEKGRFVAVVLLAVLLTFFTSERNTVWANRVKLWEDCVKKAPQKARPHHNLGLALENANRKVEAERQYRLSLTIDPTSVGAANNLGLLLASISRGKEAVSFFEQALKFDPDASVVRYNLGNVLMDLGKRKDAKHQYFKTILMDPCYAMAHNNLGFLMVQENKIPEAMYHYIRAVQLEPKYVGARINLGNLLMRMGKLSEALDQFQKTVDSSPVDRTAKENYQMAMRIKNELDSKVLALKKELDKIKDSGSLNDQALRSLKKSWDALNRAVAFYRKRIGTQCKCFNIDNYYPFYEAKRDYQKTVFLMGLEEKRYKR